MLHGTPRADVICGRGGVDEIRAGRGADRVLGGAGNDDLRGGPGADALHGGAGRDLCLDSRGTVKTSCEGRRRPFPIAWLPQCCSVRAPLDREAPTGVYVAFMGRVVDVSLGDGGMGLNLEALDESGVESIAVEIGGPQGAWRSLRVEGGPDPQSRLEAEVAVPASTPPGDYGITSVTVTDRRGNSRTVTPADYGETGYLSEFAVYNIPDEDGPELTSLSISPAEVDTSGGPATIEIAIGARDEPAGVNDASADVRLPDWVPGPLVIAGAKGPEDPPDEGTRHEGVWKQTVPLAEGAMPGYYTIGGVHLSDIAGHTSFYSKQRLEELGFPVEFLQSDGGDTTPPEIVDHWFEPTSLQASAGERTIVFFFHVRDDITGMAPRSHPGPSEIETGFEPPGEPLDFSYSGKSPVLVSGSPIDGVWREEITLEADAAAGEYELTYLSATDRAGNRRLMSNAQILAEGWAGSFENLP